MIGVTIGVGAYSDMAQRAAQSMSNATGLRCVVLGDEELRNVGLADHPAALLKLWIFDFVDEEDVLWFDADTLCVRKWNPADLIDDSAVIAARDWSWRSGIKDEADSVQVPYDEYFLSSVMVLRRSAHQQMLKFAQQILPQTTGDVYEQTALNAARYRLGIPIKWIDRRYNWSLYGVGNLQDNAAPIVAHFNSDELRRNCVNVSNQAAGNIDAEAFKEYGNSCYRYVRVGHDERQMELRDDGTIGSGGGNAERFWFVRSTASGPRLVIGSETERTCELSLNTDGSWSGSWDAFEQMPVNLMKYRGQVLVDLLGDSQRKWTGVEIGIFEGGMSEFLLRSMPNLSLWMVDRWRAPVVGDRYYDDPYIRIVGQNRMHQAMLQAVRVTEFASERRTVLLTDQVRAAECVGDKTLDFVFVDSDHSEDGTLEAINCWWDKLRPGGLMAGHDLDYPGFPGVRKAVERTSVDRGLRWNSEQDYVWYFRV